MGAASGATVADVYTRVFPLLLEQVYTRVFYPLIRAGIISELDIEYILRCTPYIVTFI